MKSGISWSIKGIDEETREAAFEAARQSGVPVSEWLRQAIAERAAEEGVALEPDDAGSGDEDDLHAVAEAVARLTRRIRSMDASARSAISGLKERLDEIERQLGRVHETAGRGERGAKSLRGVSAMVNRLARELDDADETARSMVEGLRDRGRPARPLREPADTVGEAIRSLDAQVAAMAERLNAPPPEPGARLDDVRNRLDQLLARGPTRPEPQRPPRAATLDVTLKALESRIDEAKARLVGRRSLAPTPLSVEEDQRMRRIETRLADITGRLSEPPPRPTAKAPPMDELSAAIAEIAGRQRSLDDRATPPAPREPDPVVAALAALRADVAGLAARVTALGRDDGDDREAYSDTARQAAGAPGDRTLLSAIRDEVVAVRGLAEEGARADTLDRRLDDLVRRMPDHGRLDILSEEVAALRRVLESDNSPQAVARLEMRVSEVARTVEATLSSRHAAAEANAVGLAAALADIRGAIEDLADARRSDDRDPGIVADLAASLADIRHMIENREPPSLDEIRRVVESHMPNEDRAGDLAVGRLESRLDEIAARIDGLLDRSDPVDLVGGLNDRLEVLVERIDRLAASTPEPALLDEMRNEIAAIRGVIADRDPPRFDHLEGQIRELADRLDLAGRDDADSAQLADLEARVARLAAELEGASPRTAALRQVEENLMRLQEHLGDARSESVEAARAVAREAVREFAGKGVDDLVRALRQDLDHIRSAAGDSDLRTRETLDSLHGTLATIVSRLGRLETEEVGAVPPPPSRETNVAVDAPPPVRGPAAPSARPSSSSAAHRQAPDRPLEPGTGRPDLAALRELAASTTDPTQKSAGRRADFIAAARRAAQAAVAEAAPTAEELMSEPRPPSAFARIGQAIRGRRKPLLLAAAAVILAIGVLHVYGPNLAGSKVETAAAEAARAAEPVETVVAAPPSATRAAAALDPAIPRVDQAALVAPPSDARTAMALAANDPVEGRFGEAFAESGTEAFDGARSIDAVEAADDGPPEALTVAATAPGSDSEAPAIGSDKLRAAAAAGDPAAAFEIATRYAEGRSVAQDLATAAKWYERAATGGVAVAQYRLGSLHERGQGVTKDLTAAVNWYQRAADQGNIGAMHNLAVLMSEGVDGTPDHTKALEWFLAAANYGVKDSQYNLGVIYARGLGHEPDLVESYKWFAIAAGQGDKDAATRRDEVAGMLAPDDLAKARAAVQAFHPKPTIAEANGVSAPADGWDGDGGGVTEADQRALVKKIQTLLAERGYDPGPADGIEGRKTQEAVRAFQRTIGVAETGTIDPKLVTALADRSG